LGLDDITNAGYGFTMKNILDFDNRYSCLLDDIKPYSTKKNRTNLDISDLPKVEFDKKNDKDYGLVSKSLPDVSAIYFLKHPKLGVVYVGRATNLRKRWFPRGQLKILKEGTEYVYLPGHDFYKKALCCKHMELCWLKTDKRLLAFYESFLIQVFKPKWNTQRP
jgi:hypothetical protein